MPALQIYDPRERALVTAADTLFGAAAAIARPFRRRAMPAVVRRILLLRLERIGDLLMTLPAIADVRAANPEAEIDLVVGSWNASVARHIEGVSRVETLDAAWLAREGAGLRMPALLRAAAGWRSRRYDVAINFEPDVRSNLLLAVAGARQTVGYRSAGGGALLDAALDYDPSAHTADNARRLAAAAFRRPPAEGSPRTLRVPDEHRHRAASLLDARRPPFVAVHAAGGRAVKQWDPERFAAVARALVTRRGATIVLTGTPADRRWIEPVRLGLPERAVVDLSSHDADLLTVAAVLERCELLVTGDTGPMHLAAAVGTPIVAVFGPSDPRRYAPRGPLDRVVRVDLPCAPCNRIRLPPARCTGRTPDCLALVAADDVLDAALGVLDACGARGPTA
ncbi:MAG TPA: glycosyltransferase family 9 protein [Vicinamibacterales bacterium]|nr:glycosyltransferase family 9 protein [Vicinamibacterales bacterium]